MKHHEIYINAHIFIDLRLHLNIRVCVCVYNFMKEDLGKNGQGRISTSQELWALEYAESPS